MNQVTEGEICGPCYNKDVISEPVAAYFVMYNEFYEKRLGGHVYGDRFGQWTGVCQDCLNYILAHGCIDEDLELES